MAIDSERKSSRRSAAPGAFLTAIQARVAVCLLSVAVVSVGFGSAAEASDELPSFRVPALSEVDPLAGGVRVEADALDYFHRKGVLEASGNVEVDWHDTELKAGRLRVEQTGGRIIAGDQLILETPDFRIEAESCDLSVEDETGVLKGVTVSRKDGNGVFGGGEVIKGEGGRYRLTDGYFTTCRTEPGKAPEWSLTGNEVDIDAQGYGRLEGGSFRILDRPVLFVPYALFPARQQRHTGLLLPRFGLSDERGFVYSQPWFWAIDKHHDATATFDIETAQRIGTALEYRYTPSLDVAGWLNVAYYNEQIRGDAQSDIISPLFRGANIRDNRAAASGQHRHRWNETWNLYADLLAVTDDLVLREVDSVSTGSVHRELRRSKLYTDTRLGAVGRSGFASYGVRAAWFQNLVSGRISRDPTTGAVLVDPVTGNPIVVGELDRPTLQKPLELWSAVDGSIGKTTYRVDSSASWFHRAYGLDGQRFDMTATLEQSFGGFGPLRSYAWMRARATSYLIDDTRRLAEDRTVLETLDDTALRAMGEGGFEVRTTLERTYLLVGRAVENLAGDSTGDDVGSQVELNGSGATPFRVLRHTVEPFSAFRFTSESRDFDLPLYDAVDRIDGRSVATYGVSSRFLLGKGDNPSEYQEVARVAAQQSYNFDERVLEDHFSDLDLMVSLHPAPWVSVTGLASYNLGANELRGAVSGLSFKDFEVPYTGLPESSVEVVYRFVRGENTATRKRIDDLQTAEGRAIFQLTDRLAFGVNGRFDFPASKFVESGGGIRISSACDCWSVDLGLLQRVNPDETQFRLAFTLTGLGEIGGSALTYQTPGLAGLEYGADYWRYGW